MWKNWCLLIAFFWGFWALFTTPAPYAAGGRNSRTPSIEAKLQIQAALSDEVSYWIFFRRPSDLSGAEKIGDWVARGEQVVRQLQEQAKRTQAQVQAYLSAQGIRYRSYWINNAILVQSAPSKTLQALAAFGEVEALQARKRVILDEPSSISTPADAAAGIEANINHVNADDAWGLGYTGQGIVVANIDTGVRYTHQALNSHYRGNLGDGSYDHNYNWFDPYNDSPLQPEDEHGHGSHTMGIMLGDDGSGNQTGMAPGAQWIACRGFIGSTGSDEALLACAQFMLAPTDLAGDHPDPSRRPQVVNSSWGDCEQNYDGWYRGAVDAWVAAGIYPVFSNGNAGNCDFSSPPGLNTVGNPARYGNVTGVGSTGKDDGLYASHSNWGPTDDPDTVNPASGFEILKPQVVAPGVSIRSAYAGGDATYALMTGTSMSAPHVSGLVALVWEAAPCLTGDYALTENLIEQTAVQIIYEDGSDLTPTNYPNFATGWGEIDALAAVQSAQAYCTATLQGTVSDQATLLPIEGAAVWVYDSSKLNRYLATGASGVYTLSVMAGSYTIQVSAVGYASQTVTNTVVTAGVTVTQDFALSPWEKIFLPFVGR